MHPFIGHLGGRRNEVGVGLGSRHNRRSNRNPRCREQNMVSSVRRHQRIARSRNPTRRRSVTSTGLRRCPGWRGQCRRAGCGTYFCVWVNRRIAGHNRPDGVAGRTYCRDTIVCPRVRACPPALGAMCRENWGMCRRPWRAWRNTQRKENRRASHRMLHSALFRNGR